MGIITETAKETIEAIVEKGIGSKLEKINSYSDESKITNDIKKVLLEKYGNEVYYEKLDKYITNNKIINILIYNAREHRNQIEKNDFVNRHTNRFLEYIEIKSVSYSCIASVFEWMFDFIFDGLNSISPYSDIGKIQNDIRRIENEMIYKSNTQSSSLNIQLQDIAQNVRFLVNNANRTDNEENLDCSAEVKALMEKIKTIEREYQEKYEFEAALSKYMELLQSITIKLRGYPTEQTDELICRLNCNIALCQSNLGNETEAITTLKQIDENTASKSETYYFVYAAVILENRGAYEDAIMYLDKSLEIDEEYHRAFLLRQHLYALTQREDHDSNINAVNKRLEQIEKENNDDRLIADFYMYRGMIHFAYNDAELAAEDFLEAEKKGYNSIIAKLNFFGAIYKQTVFGMQNEEYIIFPKIDYSKMNLIINGLREIIKSNKLFVKLNDTFKKNAIKIYLSSCSLAGVSHDLTPVSLYIHLYDDYELRRMFLLSNAEDISEEDLLLFNDNDNLYATLTKLINNGKAQECKNIIIGMIQNENVDKPIFLKPMLLQTCVITEDSENYWRFREESVWAQKDKSMILSMDAYIYDIEGKTEEAKQLFDKIATETKDYRILENTLRFYKRNKFFVEAEKMTFTLWDMFERSEICIDNTFDFYCETITFLVSQKSKEAEALLNRIDRESIEEAEFLQLQTYVYMRTNDFVKLLKCLEKLYTLDDLKYGLDLAICKCKLMEYDEALGICLELVEKIENQDEKLKVYWLISDLYLLKNNLDASYAWAEKAHILKKEIPSDRSHQAFFARSIRCGRFEGTLEMEKYQKKHPVIVNYFKFFYVDPNGKNVLDTITKELNEISPQRENYIDQERAFEELYRTSLVTINLLLQHFDGDWQRLFNFAERNKLRICTGNIDKLKIDTEKIKEDIVIDLNTLIIMSYYDCIPLLESIKYLHINCGIVSALQYAYLMYGYKYIENLLIWIKTAENIVLEADGYIEEECLIARAFSSGFIKACNVAKDKKIPFLCAEMLVGIVQGEESAEFIQDIVFVSIPGFCAFAGKMQPELKEHAIYKLLTGSTFISFSANTIVELIKRKNFEVTYDSLKPFLICKSDYDMKSFSAVYLLAIYNLIKINDKAAYELAKIILNDSKRIWRRGTHYRNYASVDVDAQMRANLIRKYVSDIVYGIGKIFENKSDEIINMCDNIRNEVLRKY